MEDAEALAKVLIDLEISSLGPTMATRILALSNEILEKIRTDPRLQDGAGWPLEAYALRLRDVALVQGATAKGVIDLLERLIKETGG